MSYFCFCRSAPPEMTDTKSPAVAGVAQAMMQKEKEVSCPGHQVGR